ncbi:hypothetical protein J9253_02270 [Thiothrix litoralis]|jgi:hypothetical protein|uniref:NfeD-like C-terminal domain-containing protein n=1 Tax=Thiothrix litoralis TaxID=2891210 RepID=A0ABX7WU84_9GAMM|nr:hypothetical protein [Thiothrix litoralis]QTR46797.1 hypothetical protein J9253_02270 [Thiothrix litoralis]
MELLKQMIEYVPLFQTITWALLVLIAIFLYGRQIRSLLDSLTDRIHKGGISFAGIEIKEKMITKTSDIKEEIETFGQPDKLKLLFKVQGKTWQKSTKALEVPGGCVVQVTTERMSIDGSWINAEALTFVPNVIVLTDKDGANILSKG